MTPEELPARLREMSGRVQSEGPRVAAYAMASAFLTEISVVVLARSSHPRGTRTPSAPGDPPALVGGALRRSMRLSPPVVTGTSRAVAKVSPRIVYARIQEAGGTVSTDKPHGLGSPQSGFFGHSVTLPARPYMRPTARRMAASGQLRKAAVEAVQAVSW